MRSEKQLDIKRTARQLDAKIRAKKEAAKKPWFDTRYLNHPRLGIVMWTTPAAAPAFLTHSEMASLLPKAFKHNGIAGGDVLPIASAGYIRATPQGPECYGESESLGVQSALADTITLRQMLGMFP